MEKKVIEVAGTKSAKHTGSYTCCGTLVQTQKSRQPHITSTEHCLLASLPPANRAQFGSKNPESSAVF